MPGGHYQAQEHRAEQRQEHGQMAADEQQVAPAPPRRQQPERGNEPGEPEGPVHGTEVLRLQARDERLDDEQAHQAEKHVRAHDTAPVHGQRHQECRGQGALRDALADYRRDMARTQPRGRRSARSGTAGPRRCRPCGGPSARDPAQLQPAAAPAGGGERRRTQSSAHEPGPGPTEACWPGRSGTPRLSSALSAPTSTAEMSSVPASRIISPTAWTRAADDRPAVTTATAPRAHPARCSAPTEGSRVASVSSRSASAAAAPTSPAKAARGPPARRDPSGPAGTTSSRSGIATISCYAINPHRVDAGTR